MTVTVFGYPSSLLSVFFARKRKSKLIGKLSERNVFRLEKTEKMLEAYKQSEGMSWPPNDDIELSVENILREDLIRFLSLLIAGKEENETSGKVKRLISSIGQNLCRAVSDGT